LINWATRRRWREVVMLSVYGFAAVEQRQRAAVQPAE
jgi:hypothetical protein